MQGIRAPWPGETVECPQRIRGWRVIAAAKLPATKTTQHRYMAVVETNPGPGYMFHHEVVWKPCEGFQPLEYTSTIVPYGVAMAMFVEALERANLIGL